MTDRFCELKTIGHWMMKQLLNLIKAIWWYIADQLFTLAFGFGKQFICWPLAYHDKLLNVIQ